MIATVVVLALRGAAAIVVLTTLAGGVPRLVQAALAVTLGLWSGAVAAAAGAPAALETIPSELAIGAALGVIAGLPLVAAATAGRLVDATSRARGPYAALFGLLAAAVFVAIDGHVAVLRAIVDSHRALPLPVGSPQPGVIAALGALVPAAVRLAAPWLVTAAIVELAVGVGVRVGGRTGQHAPAAAAVPAALAMVTATLLTTLAVAIAGLVG